MYLSKAAFLANLTPPNKQSFKVKSEFRSHDHVFNSQAIRKFIIFGGGKVAFFCFKQLLLVAVSFLSRSSKFFGRQTLKFS